MIFFTGKVVTQQAIFNSFDTVSGLIYICYYTTVKSSVFLHCFLILILLFLFVFQYLIIYIIKQVLLVTLWTKHISDR